MLKGRSGRKISDREGEKMRRSAGHVQEGQEKLGDTGKRSKKSAPDSIFLLVFPISAHALSLRGFSFLHYLYSRSVTLTRER